VKFFCSLIGQHIRHKKPTIGWKSKPKGCQQLQKRNICKAVLEKGTFHEDNLSIKKTDFGHNLSRE
jgi:hypothetical protein